MNFLLRGLLAGQFIPHGHCYLWKPELIWFHISSDLLIALAYFSISIGIIYFLRRRKDLPYPEVFLLFAAFLIACALTHFMAVWTLWHPDYWLSGFIKAITAIFSVLTAVIIVPLIPKALALPSRVQLAAEIKERKKIEAELNASKKRFSGILEIANDAIISTDENQKIILFNRGAERIFGYEPKEALGQSLDLLLPERFAAQHRERIGEFAEGASDVSRKMNERRGLWGLRKDGAEFPAEASISKLTLGEEKIFTVILNDISDRLDAETALRESEHRYQSLTEASPVGIFRTDRAGNCSYINDRWARMTGIPAEEAKGDGWTRSLYPADRERTYREWRAFAGSQQPFKIEYRIQRVDNGEVLWVFAQAVAERTETGEVIGYVGTITDISDRKRAEKQLAKQEKALKAILNNAPIWIWMADTNGKMQFVNKTFCFDVGVPESRFLAASHYSEVLGEAESAALISADAAALARNTPYNSEVAFTFVDGQSHELETITAKVRGNNGEAIALIGLAVDVMERKQTVLALQRSEAKYREIARHEELLNSLANQIRNSLDLDTILETAVCQVRALLQIERCFFVWYHFAADKKEADFSISILSEDSWEVVNEAKEETLASFIGEYPLSQFGSWLKKCLELEIVRVDDVSSMSDTQMGDFLLSLGMKSFLSLPIQTQSGQIGVLVCAHHACVRNWLETEVELLRAVSDRLAIAIDQAQLYNQSREVASQAKAQAKELADAFKRLQLAQTQLIQTEKMSSLGQMVAGIAHEINNPVNFIYGNVSYASEYAQNILGLIDLYQQHYPDPLLDIQEEIEAMELDFLLEDFPKVLRSIRVGADRIRQIVVSLRNFSRLDEAEVKAVDIHEGIDSTLLILQNRLKAKPGLADLQLVKDYGELPAIECYAGQMNQVFMNIIANAIDALEEKRRQLGSDGDVLPDTDEALP
ncbi:MAG: PAS domain S-box protein, partial [Cyanobacteriota bacterium]|nr:PAS domain S-box protein [Cyanobacteriota bacterium]